VIKSFEDLIRPDTEQWFQDLLRVGKVVLRRGGEVNRFADMLSGERLFQAIERSVIPADRVRMTNRTIDVPQVMYLTQGRPDASKISQLSLNGSSLIVTKLDEYIPELGALRADIAAHFAEKVFMSAVFSAKGEPAIAMHFDAQDLLILQISGSKHWKIYGHPVRHPIRLMRPQPAAPTDPPVFDETLNAGDMLFLPGGHWHHCEDGSGPSLHLVILFVPPSAAAAMRAYAEHLIGDPAFRVPLSRMTAEEKAAHEGALKARIVADITALSFSAPGGRLPESSTEEA
jgi:ribosomal protein L16 Arg81 hydroxylase